MLEGRSYETFVVALSVSLAPWLGALGLAAATWFLLRRRES
jgi:LPXTG-motif cell wall-anchored protein